MSGQFAVFASIGLVTGFMSGMFGIGGGAIRIPIIFFAGIPLISAFGINLAVIPFSSLVGAFSHRKNIDYPIARNMIIGGSMGSVMGAYFAGLIPELTLAIIFVAAAILTVLGMYFDRIAPELSRRIKPNTANIILGAFLLNLITGIRGGSGGALFPPFLKVMHLDIFRSIATSLFVTIFTAAAGIAIYWNRGNIPIMPGLAVLIGSMIGARLGSRASLRSKPFWLELGLSVLVVLLALFTVYRAL